jgi:hypothetical protein
MYNIKYKWRHVHSALSFVCVPVLHAYVLHSNVAVKVLQTLQSTSCGSPAKGKAVPTHVMKAYRGSGSIAPFILNLSSGFRFTGWWKGLCNSNVVICAYLL